MGLFEKLSYVKKPVEPAVPPLLDRLKEIGDQQAVNPPEPRCAGSSGHGFGPDGVCTFCGMTKPAVEPVPVAPAAPAPESSSCPVCGKTFRHLSRHKCKGTVAPAVPVREDRLFPTDGLPGGEMFPAAAPVAQDGYILIFDALFERGVAWPGWGAVVLFTDIVAPLASAVAKENNQEHWGTVEFGRGGPLLAAKLEKWLVATSPTGVILADSSTSELRAVKEVLKRHAKVIIQGVR